MKLPLDDPAPASATYAAGIAVPVTTQLSGRETADVVVIGAGITGLSAALHLARAGREVIVLEARSIANGGSGRALGLVLPHHKLGPAQLIARFGPDRAARLIAAILDGPRLVDELIVQNGIECAVTRGGWIMAAHAPPGEPSIHAFAGAWRKHSDQVELLGPAELLRETGSTFYRCALIDKRALGLNPYAYTAGLAQAAIKAGARIYSQSRAIKLEQNAEGWRVVTATGDVAARQVVVASDAYADALLPSVRRAILPLRAYQLVTEVLPAVERTSILPGGAILTDSRRTYGGVRRTKDGRLQLSVDGPPTRISGRAHRAAGTARLRELFPHLTHPGWADEWSGWIGMTRSHLPHVWQVDDGIIAAVGMNGRGIAMATLLGRDLSLRLTGSPDSACFMPLDPPRAWPVHPILHPALEIAMQWYRLRDRFDLKKRHSA